jgi:hypothetical protein
MWDMDREKPALKGTVSNFPNEETPPTLSWLLSGGLTEGRVAVVFRQKSDGPVGKLLRVPNAVLRHFNDAAGHNLRMARAYAGRVHSLRDACSRCHASE